MRIPMTGRFWTNHDSQQDQTAAIALAAGINAGFLTIYIPRSVYGRNEHKTAQVEVQEEPLYEPASRRERHLEPISGKSDLSPSLKILNRP